MGFYRLRKESGSRLRANASPFWVPFARNNCQNDPIMSDALITAILSISLIGMTALGIYVSFVPLDPAEKELSALRRRSTIVSIGFVILTGVIMTLSVTQTQRAGKQQNAANNKISTLTDQIAAANEKLATTQTSLQSSLLDAEFMKGQLASLGQRVTTLDFDGKLAASNNTAILQQLRDAQNEQLSHLPTLQRLSNKDLKETVHAFARRLESEGKGLEQLDDDIATDQKIFVGVDKRSQDQNKVLADIAIRRSDWSAALASTIAKEGPLAIAYRDELLRRMGRTTPPMKWLSEDSGKQIRADYIFAYGMFLDDLAQDFSR